MKGLLVLALLLAPVIAVGEVYSDIRVYAEAGEGSYAESSVSITTTENGVTTVIEEHASSSNGERVRLHVESGSATTTTQSEVSVAASSSVHVEPPVIQESVRAVENTVQNAVTTALSKADAVRSIVRARFTTEGALEVDSAVVVVGTRVREAQKTDALTAHTSRIRNAAYVEDTEDLAFLAARHIVEDENVKNVEFEGSNIIVLHIEEVQLFGLFPVTMTKRVEASSDGRVSVRFPWWGVFAKKFASAADTEAAIKFAFEEEEDAITRQSTALLRQARMFETLSNALKARHDVAMNSVRNMK